MTLLEFTSNEVEVLLNKSDSEFELDDSITDHDWLPGNTPGNESSLDCKSSKSDDQAKKECRVIYLVKAAQWIYINYSSMMK